MFTKLKNKQLLLSAILLTLIFFISGINKAKSVKDTAKGLHSKLPFLNINLCNFIIICVIILEIVAPILIILSLLGYGKFMGQCSCYAIILFTVIATLLYHYPSKKENFHPCMRNVAIIGGFLALAKHIQ